MLAMSEPPGEPLTVSRAAFIPATVDDRATVMAQVAPSES
jgi:hypothetical protein